MTMTILHRNDAIYTATLVMCWWAGAVIEKVTGVFGQVFAPRLT